MFRKSLWIPTVAGVLLLSSVALLTARRHQPVAVAPAAVTTAQAETAPAVPAEPTPDTPAALPVASTAAPAATAPVAAQAQAASPVQPAPSPNQPVRPAFLVDAITPAAPTPVRPQPLAARMTPNRPSGRTLQLVATAYGPSLKDNYPYGATDYFGAPLKPGDVAVDPRVIPLGTRLWVTGYHDPLLPKGGFTAVARDEGDAIKGHRIDIFLDASPQQVSNFGVQHVTVTILGN